MRWSVGRGSRWRFSTCARLGLCPRHDAEYGGGARRYFAALQESAPDQPRERAPYLLVGRSRRLHQPGKRYPDLEGVQVAPRRPHAGRRGQPRIDGQRDRMAAALYKEAVRRREESPAVSSESHVAATYGLARGCDLIHVSISSLRNPTARAPNWTGTGNLPSPSLIRRSIERRDSPVIRMTSG